MGYLVALGLLAAFSWALMRQGGRQVLLVMAGVLIVGGVLFIAFLNSLPVR